MIEGSIETVAPDGVVRGWLRDPARPAAPAALRIRFAGRIVARDTAHRFRAGLLQAGRGHGHYGFAARLTETLPPGPCELALCLEDAGASLAFRVAIPALAPLAPARVEDLLASDGGWTAPDLLGALACLDPEGNCARLGVPRFVDRAFRFVLSRWPSPAEAAHYAASLGDGRIGPSALLAELLGSLERADLEPSLISPFHPEFPFQLRPAQA